MISLTLVAARRRIFTLLLVGLLLAACTRPVDRPRDGAQPLAAGGAAGRLLSEPPPTLAPAASLAVMPTIAAPTVAPSPPPEASPGRSGGIYPLITNIQPTPGSALPPGEVVIGARVTGAGNLSSVLAFVDGNPYQPLAANPPSRSLSFSFVRELELGQHEVRIEARDESGQMGLYRWQFTIGPRPPPATVPPPRDPSVAEPLQTFPIPTLVIPTFSVPQVPPGRAPEAPTRRP
ncbi:MAG: Ig-like domain-containing protein [Chloroflexi bacterium]|nr:Ig-like domain-containing protein [Chloroflexota bacterium]